MGVHGATINLGINSFPCPLRFTPTLMGTIISCCLMGILMSWVHNTLDEFCVVFAGVFIDTVTHPQRNLLLMIILPSSTLSVFVLLPFILTTLVAFWRFQRQKHTPTRSVSPSWKICQSEIMMAKANLKKVGNTVSATNPLTFDCKNYSTGTQPRYIYS